MVFFDFILLVFILLYIIRELKIFIIDSSNFVKLFMLLFTLMHFGISFLFAFFLDKFSTINDPIDYYNAALTSKNWLSNFGLGRDFMPFLIYPFVKLKISTIPLFLLFSAISFKGFLLYFKFLNLNSLHKNKYWLLLFYFLPSLHFWTGSIGKEAILVYLLAFILTKINNIKIDFKLLIVFFLMFCLRPHLFFVICLSFVLFYLFDKKSARNLKIKILSGILFSIFFLIPISFLYFLDINFFNFKLFLEGFNNLIIAMKSYGGSKIDLSETNTFSRILYLIFMPLPFLYELKNKAQTVVAFENVIFLILLGSTIFCFYKNKVLKIQLNNQIKFAMIATVLIIVLFGSYLYNLGLGNRMRTMFLPYLIFISVYLINNKPIQFIDEK